jgi:deazaflavin-dependent oxidoreductase (nitroreductase family)
MAGVAFGGVRRRSAMTPAAVAHDAERRCRMAERERPAAYGFLFRSGLGRLAQDLNTWIYRLSGGRVGARLRGAPVCLVTTIGRRSGEPRTVPLLYLRDGRQIILVASKGGWDTHPLWYRNMKSNPEVVVEVEGEKLTMRAEDASDDARAAYWPRLVNLYPDYARYQSWTDRRIPVVVLSPSGRPA